MNRILKFIACSTIILAFLSSCVTSKDTNLMQDIKKDYGTIPPPDEYRIIPGDILEIVVYVWDDEETAKLFEGYKPRLIYTREGSTSTHATLLDYQSNWGRGASRIEGGAEEGTDEATAITVYADGTINFPYIGRIYVADLTILEARKLITSRLQEISENASANVTLRNKYFSVIGDSGARRVSMRNNNMTIYQALASAGNISDYSKRSNVTILRQTNSGTIVKPFDLRSKDIINTEYYYIQPNDVIYFPQTKTKFFGATSSFLGIFGLITSFTSIVVMAFRIF